MDAFARLEALLRARGNEESTIRSKLGLVRKWGALSPARLDREIADHSLSSKTKIYKALADFKEANDLDNSREKKLSRAHSLEHNVNYMQAARAGDRGEQSWARVLAARDAFLRRAGDSPQELQQALLVQLYTELPPLRLADYKLLRFEDDGEHNFVQLRPRPQLVIRRYKTAKAYGTNVLPLPPPLAAAVRRVRAEPGRDSGRRQGFVFSIDIEYHLRKLLGCSVNMLRKLYVSDVLPSKSAEERIEIAKRMGHSLSTQIHVYQRYS